MQDTKRKIRNLTNVAQISQRIARSENATQARDHL